ncbi:MAG: hypothetical protein ACREP1_01885 [Rhodanobacteraceae bacterium]
MEPLAVEPDDGKRTREGVVACLRDTCDGTSRLIFDDVVVDQAHDNARTWRHRTLYTWAQFDNVELDEMNRSDEDYQRIGEALVARLLAINGRMK